MIKYLEIIIMIIASIITFIFAYILMIINETYLMIRTLIDDIIDNTRAILND